MDNSSGTEVESNVRPRHNLPAPLTSLIGREADTAEACDLLRWEEVRLLTLTGPGGVGKTRLALKVAGELLNDFDHGVFFVSLASISDPQLVVSRIGQALDVREFGGQSLLDLLNAYLREKQLLLVLDNYEHVLAAASLVSELLLACPALKILVTSRALLRLDGEHEFPVTPLDLPDPSLSVGMLPQAASAQLFLQRAQAVQRDFGLTDHNGRAVAEICIHLDGLPLAIELAAARVKLFDPGAILRRLDGVAEAGRPALLTSAARDVPARQQTLEQTIAWSYDLLSEAHRAVFRRLSVFAGGCTLDAAAAVCADHASEEIPPETGESIDYALQTLLEFNLLTRGSGPEGERRYGMLETIREYAWKRLRESGEEDRIRQRHAQVFLAFAERAEEELLGPDDVAWMARLEAEHDNLRAALRWTLETPGMDGLCLQLVAAVGRFWIYVANIREGLDWALAALALPGAQPATLARVKALCAATQLQAMFGNFDVSQQMAEESIQLARELGERRELAYCLTRLVMVRAEQSDLDGARLVLEETIPLFREVADQWGLANALGYAAYYGLYDSDTSIALVEESLALSQALGNRERYITALAIASITYSESGDYERARSLMEQSLVLIRLGGQRRYLATGLNSLGEHLRCLGDYQAARVHFEESLVFCRELGFRIVEGAVQINLGFVGLRQVDLDLAASSFQEGLVLYIEIGTVYEKGECLAGIAGLATAIGQERRAALLLGAAEALFNRFDVTFHAADRMDHEYIVQTLSAQMNAEALAAAWAEGRTLPEEQAIALALEITQAVKGG